MATNPFEKSKKDKETGKMGKEGSKREEKFDLKQMKPAPAKKSGKKC